MYTRENGGSRRTHTPEGDANLQIHLVGPLPIIQHLLGEMDFGKAAADHLRTRRTGKLDHARTLSILIMNILLSPAPMYRIAEWAEPYDAEALGLTPTEKQALNDDRVARMLDVLASTRSRGLFFQIALHIIRRFALDLSQIHHDTTTVTLQGRYDGSTREPRITHGVNKDHRPDLKQLVLGINATADGTVPVSHEIYSGNRTDDRIHPGNVDRLRELIGGDDFIYVADSKLCTRENLRHLEGYGGRFVTVLPRTRAEDRRFRDGLRQGKKVRWRKLLTQVNPRRPHDSPAIYRTTAAGPQTTEEGHRIIWWKSSLKAQLDAQARERAIGKANLELFDLGARLNRGKLKREVEIRQRIEKILQRYRVSRFLRIHLRWTVAIEIRRLRRGRPVAGDPVQTSRRRVYHLEVLRDRENIRAEARTDGVFPLLTNLPSRIHSKKSVLLIYKHQAYVEKRHALFKTELGIAPVYLKKPHRVAGLIHATFLAMIVEALIERTLRQTMRREEIEALPILPERRATKTPTAARLFDMFSGVTWYEVKQGDRVTTFPIQLTPLQKKLLRFLGMDPASYT